MPVLAIDAGTTGVTALVVGEDGGVLARGYREFAQLFPRPGWVEHEPDDIWTATVAACRQALAGTDAQPTCVGITDQRETAVVWDRRTGRSPRPAIVWQDRRTTGICDRLREAGHEPRVAELTGLRLDPYFTATKFCQQAALFGQACYSPGDSKCTYGTGSFVLTNTGTTPVRSDAGLLTTVAWDVGDGLVYALEGSIFVTGAAVQWLRDGLGLIDSAAEIEGLARTVPDSGDLVFVPALTGLGAPHWDPHARGALFGLTRGTTRAHIARATLESIAFQVRDVVDVMVTEGGLQVPELSADGGASAHRPL